jgi:hypothetical protein
MDRVENWKRFSEHMEEYIRDQTVEKYGIEDSENGGIDLMSITRKPIICVWHVLKYSLRVWNGKMKSMILKRSLIMQSWHGRRQKGG